MSSPRECTISTCIYLQEILEDFRRYQVGTSLDNTPPKLEQHAFILERWSGLPGRLGRDRWLEFGSRSNRSRSTKAIIRLEDLGLVVETVLAFPDGTEVDGLIIAEWGYELICARETVAPKGRNAGNSSTCRKYHELLRRHIGQICYASDVNHQERAAPLAFSSSDTAISPRCRDSKPKKVNSSVIRAYAFRFLTDPPEFQLHLAA